MLWIKSKTAVMANVIAVVRILVILVFLPAPLRSFALLVKKKKKEKRTSLQWDANLRAKDKLLARIFL